MNGKSLTLVVTAPPETLLTPVDGRERAAVLFVAGTNETADHVELLCPRVYRPDDDDYAIREPWLCSLKAEAVIRNVLIPLGQEAGIVHIHDHGDGIARFSSTDNRGLPDKLESVRTRRAGAWFVRGVVGCDGVWMEAYRPDSEEPEPVGVIKVITPSAGIKRVYPINSRLGLRIATRLDSSEHERTRAVLGYEADRVMEALSSTRIGIIGGGGIGSVVSVLLPRLGFTDFVLVDDDRLELSNLNRWILGRPTDQGRPKVEIVRERLLEAHPELRIDAVMEMFPSPEAETALKRCDILLCCPDNAWTRYCVDQFAARFMKVCLSLGSGVDTDVDGRLAIGSQLRAFVPTEGGRCGACQGMRIDNLSPPAVERHKRETGYSVSRSVVTINSVIASLAVTWLFEWFRGAASQLPTYLQFDEPTLALANLTHTFGVNDDCPTCGRSQDSILGRGDGVDNIPVLEPQQHAEEAYGRAH